MAMLHKSDLKKMSFTDYNYIVYNEIYLLNIFGKYMKWKVFNTVGQFIHFFQALLAFIIGL